MPSYPSLAHLAHLPGASHSSTLMWHDACATNRAALRRSARYGVLFALALGCGGVHRDRATGSGGAAGSDGTAGLGGGAAMGGASAGGDAGRGGIGTAGASGGGASGSSADGGAVTDDAGAGGAVVQPRSVALASSSWDVRLGPDRHENANGLRHPLDRG